MVFKKTLYASGYILFSHVVNFGCPACARQQLCTVQLHTVYTVLQGILDVANLIVGFE